MRLARIFLRLHNFPLFTAVCATAGVLGFGLAQLHLPQAVEQSYGDYTRLTGFHILPLVLTPLIGFVLAGEVLHTERQAARWLHTARGGLMLGCTTVVLGALLPASMSADVDSGVQVTAENTLFVVGASAVLNVWIDRSWSWFPVFALGATGLVAADHSTVSTLAVVDRTPGDIAVCTAIWLAGLALYVTQGSRRPSSDTPYD